MIGAQRWNGSFFERTTLYTLGLRVQLGHHGRPCHAPIPVPAGPFTVLHTNGVHDVRFFRCGCEVADSLIEQLLAFEWFPATAKQPASAVSFQALREFQALTHQCKSLSAYHYCHGVARLQDNTNLANISVRASLFQFYLTVANGLVGSISAVLTRQSNLQIHSFGKAGGAGT